MKALLVVVALFATRAFADLRNDTPTQVLGYPATAGMGMEKSWALEDSRWRAASKPLELPSRARGQKDILTAYYWGTEKQVTEVELSLWVYNRADEVTHLVTMVDVAAKLCGDATGTVLSDAMRSSMRSRKPRTEIANGYKLEVYVDSQTKEGFRLMFTVTVQP